MSNEELLKLADRAELAERCEHCGGPRGEDEQAELAAMANADKAADPNWME